jgi:hypothetical protein
MIDVFEPRNLTRLNSEARKAVSAAFDALRDWSDEVHAANNRCLTKVLDHVAAAQRATGWPEHLSAVTRDNIVQTSKLQTQLIDQLLQAWDELLETGRAPTRLPQGFHFLPARSSGSTLHEAMPDMAQLGELSVAPLKAWMQAADIWQRHWMAAISSGWAIPPPVMTRGSARPTS